MSGHEKRGDDDDTHGRGVGESLAEPDDEICVEQAYLDVRRIGGAVGPPQAVRGPVLFPPHGLPYGTAHGMLRVDGAPISYAQYCAPVSCERKDNVLVN